MDIELVSPTTDDYYQVDELLLYLHNKHGREYPDYYNILNNFNSRKEYNESIKEKDKFIILAKQYEEVLGILWAETKEKPGNKYMKARKELWLEGIIVRNSYRKRGIGKLLMEELISRGKADNFHSIELMVWSKNNEAINLYKKYFEDRAIIMTHSL